MSMLSQLGDPALWQIFYEYKYSGGHLSREEQEAFAAFVQTQGYLPAVEAILRGERFPIPKKVCISKMHSAKKRVVYTYPEAENRVLKLLTWLLQGKYDTLFADNLYSFRPRKGVRDAVLRLIREPKIKSMWSYKADIRNYFNSIPVQRLLPLLRKVLAAEPEVYAFLEVLLSNPLVDDGGQIISEEKGIMAGTPISAFLANLYLSEIDHYFQERGAVYARYSDDIILFAATRQELEAEVTQLKRLLGDACLQTNTDKEAWTQPGQMWTFLGISYRDGVVDVAPASVEKLKAKMRRKTRALVRWKARKGASNQQAARAFIRVFNRKLFDNPAAHELTWVRWYFPLINTTESLKQIDVYSQSCIRYLATGKHTKRAYDFTYQQIKELGYISLVNRYYKDIQTESGSAYDS